MRLLIGKHGVIYSNYDIGEINKFNSKLNSFRLKCKDIFGEEYELL